MKKLFVLFLLVALVPFTVGCGLFGDNDDTTPVNLPTLKASISGFAFPGNLRAATLEQFLAKNIFLRVGAARLRPVKVVDKGNNIHDVDFQDAVDPTVYSQIVSSLELIEVRVDVNGTLAAPAYVPPTFVVAANPVVIPVTSTGAFDSTKTVTVKDASTGETVPNVTVPVLADKTNQITIDSVSNGSTAIGTSSTSPATVDSLMPNFVATLSEIITQSLISDFDFKVTCTNITSGKSEVLTETGLIIVSDGTAGDRQINIMVHRSLRNAQTYKVAVEYVSAAGKIVAPKTFYFKTPAAQ